MEGFLWEVDKAENKNDEYVTGEAVQTVLLYVGQENLYSFIPSEENMLAVMRDMVIAGADTVNSAMEFALYYMALDPEVQSKVREEIDQIIGSSGTPSYTDKDR